MPMAEASRRDRTVEEVARLLEESSLGTAGARQLRDRVSLCEAAEMRARAYMKGDPIRLAWWEANRHDPAALRIRAARLASRGNVEMSTILLRLADWRDSQNPPAQSPSRDGIAAPVPEAADWRTFESFYLREYGSLCMILSERTGLPAQPSRKLITKALNKAFDDWENIAASGNPGEWVIGCAVQHFRELELPDEDSSWTLDVQSPSAPVRAPAAQPGSTQTTTMRVAGALATSALVPDVLRAEPTTQPTAARWEADHLLTEIYLGEYRSLVRLAVLLLHDVPTAEEVVQEAFLAMHTGWRRLRDTEKALSYLRQAVVNRSRSVLRHRTIAAGKEVTKHVPDEPSAEAGAIALLERSPVVDALRRLPDRQREAIVLRYYADLSEADIAATMGISRGAVKSQTARGMTALKSVLEQETP